jgi:hypothetical protein
MTDRELVYLHQPLGCRQVALVKEGEHLCGGNFSRPMREVRLARGLVSLS